MTDSSACIDVDECQNEPCDQNANCTNMPGNFSCTCRTGYSGDGVSCSELKTVLVFGGYWMSDLPTLLVDAKDRMDPKITMSFDKETQISYSCAVTFRNRFYVFGGQKYKRQISEVKECKLTKIGNLDFEHSFGACSNLDNQKLYLCFDQKNPKRCRSAVDPLKDFTKIPFSTHDHRATKTAASPSKF